MKQLPKWILIAGALLIGYALYYFFVSTPPKSANGTITVTASRVLEEKTTVTAQTLGTVEAYASVEIKSMVTGSLINIGFQEGDMVEKDQILFEIDPRPFQAALSQANASQARDQATLKHDQMLLARNEQLVKKGYTSKQDYDSLATNVSAATAAVKASEAAAEHARLQLEYATIRAPITGKTGNISLKLGSVIKANDTIPLVVINQINPIYVTFTLPQNSLAALQTAKQQGSVEVKALLKNQLIETGELIFVDNRIDAATGTIQVKAAFKNTNHPLWPGQHVTVELPIERRTQALLIPSLAIMTSQQGFYVFVLDANKRAHRRNITPGAVVGQRTIIEKGLEKGDQVITSGQLRIQDGAEVSVNTTP